MTDYVYSKVAVYAELGGALRLARNTRSFVTDPVTAAPVNVTQGGFTAPYLDTDSSGIADFTATTPGPIRLTTGATFVDVYSEQLPGDLLAAAASATASAADAALSASLVGAPADSAVAAIVGNPASATSVSLGSIFARSTLVNIVFDGDSLTAGSGATSKLNYVNDTVDGLDARAIITNVGIAGQTIALMLSGATDVDGALVAGALNICSAFGGTNDMFFSAGSTPVATIYANIVAYHNARKAAGWDKTVAYTITPRSDAGTPSNFETNRQALNALIVAGWSTFADALVDIGNDPVMGLVGATTGPLYADLVHPSNAGHALIAGLVRKALGTLGTIGAHDHTRYVQSASIFVEPSECVIRAGAPTLGFNDLAPCWNFAAALAQGVVFSKELPADWNTYTIDLLWCNAGAGAGTVRFDYFYTPVTDGVAIAGSTATFQSVAAGAQNVVTLTKWNIGTPGPAVPSGRLAVMVQRTGTNAADTLANSIQLLGVYLRKAT